MRDATSSQPCRSGAGALASALSSPRSTTGPSRTSGSPGPMPNSSATNRSGESDGTSDTCGRRYPQEFAPRYVGADSAGASSFDCSDRILPVSVVLSHHRHSHHRGELEMSNLDSLPYVEAQLNYLGPMTERPRYYAYETDAGEQGSHMTYDPHTMRIHDLRPIASELGLDTQGFALVEQRSQVQDFWDDDEVRRVYYPEAERFIAEVTGASRVFIFDHTLRRRVVGAADRDPTTPRQPATRVHVDHTGKSGPQR